MEKRSFADKVRTERRAMGKAVRTAMEELKGKSAGSRRKALIDL